MKFLHLLSTEATQTIAVRCLSTAASKTTNSDWLKKSVSFVGWNGQMLEDYTLLEPHVLLDGCKIQDGSWHQSHFFFRTQDSQKLPVVNFQVFPAAQQGYHRRQDLEVGPVCFL
uniref:Fibrillar collagen NC1 domain-containing protein n=2 Tax=Paramormyrops kingsleyae TaxID=1676925 RepID=A0A3B3R5H0_9TELE